jgi:hypothetical protein
MNKNIFLDEKIYNKVKQLADQTYKTHGAYKSMFIVKKYKELGGTFNKNYTDEKLTQWLKEQWKDIGNKEYPVFRPTKRINKSTPLTVDEIDTKQLKQQIELKQKIKNTGNLPPFKAVKTK